MEQILIDRREVELLTGISRSAIYSLMRKGHFPEPLKISIQCVRWRRAEVLDWVEALPRATGQAA